MEIKLVSEAILLGMSSFLIKAIIFAFVGPPLFGLLAVLIISLNKKRRNELWN